MRLRDNTNLLRPYRSGVRSFQGSQDQVIDRAQEDLGDSSDDPTQQGSDQGREHSYAEGESRADTPAMRWGESARAPNSETSRYARELKMILASLNKGQHTQRTPQRIVVAGVTPGSEASIIARGLAATCAAGGYRVLLVDANLDCPTVHRDFGVSNRAGLSDLLSTSGSPHGYPQATQLPNLAVIAAGPKPANYSGLLARERVFHRLEPISSHFDYIIADAGTLAASLLSRLSAGADNVVLAVKEHVSSMRELENMIRTLRSDSVPEPAVLMVE